MFEALYQEALDRKQHPKNGSYTNYLFDKGLDKILKKVGEEATEVVIAAKNEELAELILETNDLLYHLSVLLVEKGVTLDALKEEAKTRVGKQSRLAERKEIDTY